MTEQKNHGKAIATNKKALYNYEIVDTYEAGIVLTGSEMKSIRAGQVNIRDGYAVINNNELWLMNTHISQYRQANRQNHEPLRLRKLLFHRREINKIIGLLQEKGLTLVPLRLYFLNSRVKIQLGLGRGKKQYDKRQALRKQDDERQMKRALQRKWKGYF